MITRFAPSPTGLLHLGHAFSALTAYTRAQGAGGQFLLRIEDIDAPRCRPDFEQAIYDDLRWLGLEWQNPVLRQSERLDMYRDAVDILNSQGLTYPCSCTRADIKAALSAPQEGSSQLGPDGLVYPGTCRDRPISEAQPNDAMRLNMRKAVDALARAPRFHETGPEMLGDHELTKSHLINEVGDIVLSRKDIGTSYHIAVTVDDAAQEVTEVVRGMDLFPATPIHVLLQHLLSLPTPTYHHHRLIRDDAGKRLAKRDDARALETYRQAGKSADDIRKMLGFQPIGAVSSISRPSSI